MDDPNDMDLLDQFWSRNFGRRAALIERRLIAAFARTVGPEDPMFPILMMQVCILYETLGSVEKAVLQHGPALESRMANLAQGMDKLSGDLTAITEKLAAVQATSMRLLNTQQRLMAHRDLELRLLIMPEWLKVLIIALSTAFIMLIGAGIFAMMW